MKKILKDLKIEVRKVQNFKAAETEIEIIKENAERYAGGNVSYWVRYAAMNHKPRPEELEPK